MKMSLIPCLCLISLCATGADPAAVPEDTPEAQVISRLTAMYRAMMPRLVAPERVGSRLCSSEPALPALCVAWKEQLLEVARMPADWSGMEGPVRSLRLLLDMLFNAWTDDAAMQAAFIDELEVAPLMVLGQYAMAKEELLRLRETPWELKITDMGGAGIDLAQLRGRPVIVAFWSAGCEGSRRQIPKLKALYSKYQSQGLQIIGLTGEEPLGREGFESFLASQGMTWPQSVEAAQNRKRFDEFGFQWVSNLLLFDTNGLLLRAGPSFVLADWDDLIQAQLQAAGVSSVR